MRGVSTNKTIIYLITMQTYKELIYKLIKIFFFLYRPLIVFFPFSSAILYNNQTIGIAVHHYI